MNDKNEIENGQAIFAIEFGSTRIKSVLINSKNEVIATGSYTWENSFENGIWTYPLEQIHSGLQSCYKDLKKNVYEKYKITLKKFKAGGISAMMHGYLAFDSEKKLLTPFRTWRNTITAEASKKLSELFNFPIPERWTISHLEQAILNKEEHVSKIDFVCTLSSYIHFLLTDQKVIGTCDASGMFPIDENSICYNQTYAKQFYEISGFDVNKIFPKVVNAGFEAGKLTKKGAKFLDPDGDLIEGIPFCAPEGDAGTGMTATNSVCKKTGNISAGTSVFAMVVLEQNLKNVYPGIIDIVTTPQGSPVAMVHANNCTGEHNYWINFFSEILELFGSKVEINEIFSKTIQKSLEADTDTGNLIACNYLSGETITGFNFGRPFFARGENAKFNLANFMRAQMFSSLTALRSGMDILFEKEKIPLLSMTGSGGYFKSEAGLKYMAAALHTPISAMKTAGEGGPWGMALLASYMIYKSGGKNKSLSDFLNEEVFFDCKKTTSEVDENLKQSFDIFYKRFNSCLEAEKIFVENL